MCSSSWKWAVVGVAALAVAATGCSKKQTVKSDGGATTPPAASAPAQEAPKTEAPQPAMTAQQAEAARGAAVTEEKASQFADVLFDFDRSDLSAGAKKTCQDVAAFMQKNPGAKLLIEGHADARGTAEYNIALGERRATSVKNYLQTLGVPAGALSTVSFGKERPADPGSSEEAYAKNRRAHFVVK